MNMIMLRVIIIIAVCVFLRWASKVASIIIIIEVMAVYILDMHVTSNSAAAATTTTSYRSCPEYVWLKQSSCFCC